MVKILTDKDADLKHLEGKTIAIIGYGVQGKAQAWCMMDSGVDVVVGVREGGKSWEQVKKDGLTPVPVKEAAMKCDIIHLLIPDEVQAEVYEEEIKEFMQEGKTISCSHGFNIVFNRIVPPKDVDVIMVAPKSPGTEERKRFIEGFGVPGLVAVKQDASGNARNVALAMAKAMGFTRAGVLECSFKEEAYEDLFGEQAVLCGGTAELIKAGFETLVEKGYPPEMAYFECLHEMKLIVDLIYEGGIQHMAKVISNTAEYGMWSVGHKIITPDVKERMKKALERVENGEFAEEWINEYKNGMPNLKAAREEIAKHPIEIVGKEIRSLFKKK